MTNSNALIRSRRSVLLTVACAFGLMLLPLATLQAADKPLPLTPTFEKAASGEAPFVLKLKNDSKDTLKLSAKVLLSVVNHAMDKARLVPEQSVEAGHALTIKDLTADDKVIVSAAGYAPLEVKVPFKIKAN
jgi:hypothetical protein